MKKDNKHTARRTQMWRVEEIFRHIKSGSYPNCVQMADKIQVSSKTLKRDIEFMRDALSMPIEYDESRHGFYFTRPVEKPFGGGVDRDDIRELVEANKTLSKYIGTSLEKLMREAFQQFKQDLGLGQVPPDTFAGKISFRPLAPVKVDAKALQVILGALLRRRGLQFKYTNQGKEEERQGLPYFISNINQCLYVFLYCQRDREVQLFPIHQMCAPRMTEKRFVGPKQFDPDKYLENRFITAGGNEDHKVVVELDARATEQMRHRQIPAMTEFIELPNGCSRVHLRLNTLEEIERWVLVLGTRATVLEPRALIERLAKTTRELAERYERMLKGNQG